MTRSPLARTSQMSPPRCRATSSPVHPDIRHGGEDLYSVASREVLGRKEGLHWLGPGARLVEAPTADDGHCAMVPGAPCGRDATSAPLRGTPRASGARLSRLGIATGQSGRGPGALRSGRSRPRWRDPLRLGQSRRASVKPRRMRGCRRAADHASRLGVPLRQGHQRLPAAQRGVLHHRQPTQGHPGCHRRHLMPS
jgi:hypothetical protein